MIIEPRGPPIMAGFSRAECDTLLALRERMRPNLGG